MLGLIGIPRLVSIDLRWRGNARGLARLIVVLARMTEPWRKARAHARARRRRIDGESVEQKHNPERHTRLMSHAGYEETATQ